MLLKKLVILFGFVIPLMGFAQSNPLNLKKGIAVSGYDVVSYFENKPVEGKSDYSASYQGATYLFHSKHNLEKFNSNPDKYAPQYGGWCAYAMGEDGSKVKVDPETFKITNGKLYLFYNFGFTNTLDYWNKDEKNLAKKADEYWSKLQK